MKNTVWVLTDGSDIYGVSSSENLDALQNRWQNLTIGHDDVEIEEDYSAFQAGFDSEFFIQEINTKLDVDQEGFIIGFDHLLLADLLIMQNQFLFD